MNIKDGIVIPRERIIREIEAIDVVIAVIEACPAPVEMEHIEIVIAIKHVCMTAIGTRGSIIHGHSCIKVFNQVFFPLERVILITVLQVGAISEIVTQGWTYILRIGTTSIGTIAHFDTHACMVFQQSRGIHFCLRAGKIEEVGHQLKTIGCLTEIGLLPAIVAVIAVGIIAMTALTMTRPFPITHDLTHGVGHTTRLAMTTVDGIGVFGSHVVVKVGLVPDGRQQRFYTAIGSPTAHLTGFGKAVPVGHGLFGTLVVVGEHLAEACLVVVKESHQAIGELCGEIAFGGITQDGFGAVVGTDDDEALRLHCEDIEGRLTIVGAGRVNQISLS